MIRYEEVICMEETSVGVCMFQLCGQSGSVSKVKSSQVGPVVISR